MTTPFIRRQLLPESSLWTHFQSQRLPAQFMLELTARCALNCRHCYINRPAGDTISRQKELSLAEITDITAQAVELGAFWCALTGGDPLLRPDFAAIYLALKRQGLLVSVFTSGVLITADHARLWRDYPPRDLEITVYGATEATYERITRRPGSYAAFRRGLDLLREFGVPVRLKAIALRSNQHELTEIGEICRAYSKDIVRFSTLLHLRLDGDEAGNAAIRAERLSPCELRACRIAFQEAPCPDGSTPLPAEDVVADVRRLFRCGAGKGSFTIGSDGAYRLCLTLIAPGTTFSLREGTLREAWERFTPVIRALQTETPAYLAKCGTCARRSICLSCPAYAYLETGEMDGVPAYFCKLATSDCLQNT